MMNTQRFELKSEDHTQRLAHDLAPQFKAGDLLLLEGNLGAGKSTFARNLIRALGITEKHIPSPTYTIIQQYDQHPTNQKEQSPSILHMDAYRLTSEEELHALDILPLRATHLFIVEWPQNIGWSSKTTNPHGKTYKLTLTTLQEEDTRLAELTIS